MNVVGTYKIIAPKLDSKEVGNLRWFIHKQGNWEFGDVRSERSSGTNAVQWAVPEAVIRGDWRQLDDQLVCDVQTVGNRPAENEPRTPDTKLKWTFKITHDSPVLLKSLDGALTLEQLPSDTSK